MYKIIKDGKTIAITEKLNYIKLSSNGVYVSSDEREAQGVAHNNTPYNLIGRAPMEGCETVFVVEVDGGECIYTGDIKQTDADALIVDHEYRIILIEMGVA